MPRSLSVECLTAGTRASGDAVAPRQSEQRSDVRHHQGVIRARQILIVSVVVGLAFLTTLGGYLLVTDWRPTVVAHERYGIDVSHHQGVIDWGRVAADDIDHAYIKSTEGQTLVDERFADNWAGSRAAGVERGAYHFFSLCSPGSGQARNFLETVPDDASALPPAVDLEFGACSERPDASTVERDVRTFITSVEADRDVKVVLYVLPAFADM